MGYGTGYPSSLLALLLLAGSLSCSSGQSGITLPGAQGSNLDSGSSTNDNHRGVIHGNRSAEAGHSPGVSGSKGIAGVGPQAISQSSDPNDDAGSIRSPVPDLEPSNAIMDSVVSTGAHANVSNPNLSLGNLTSASTMGSSENNKSSSSSSDYNNNAQGSSSSADSHSINSSSSSSSHSSGCLQDPTQPSCSEFSYPASEAVKDLDSVCSENKGLSGCAVFKACKTKPKSSVGKQPDTCSEFKLLATICKGDEKMETKVMLHPYIAWLATTSSSVLHQGPLPLGLLSCHIYASI
jgi:hypothetical protein